MSLVKRLKWMDDGKCLETGGLLFISSKTVDRLEAKKVCADCPVRMQCLEYALEKSREHGSTTVGVWGGVDFGQ